MAFVDGVERAGWARQRAKLGLAGWHKTRTGVVHSVDNVFVTFNICNQYLKSFKKAVVGRWGHREQ